MRIVVEIPEPHGRTERHARGYVVSALAAVDNTRTRHDAHVYWGERVKSFDRVYTAVVERPQDVQLVKYLADALQAVASGHHSTAVTYLQRVLKMLDEEVSYAANRMRHRNRDHRLLRLPCRTTIEHESMTGIINCPRRQLRKEALAQKGIAFDRDDVRDYVRYNVASHRHLMENESAARLLRTVSHDVGSGSDKVSVVHCPTSKKN